MQIHNLLKQKKIIAILRGLKREQVIPVTEAIREGGIQFAEVTFSQSSASCLEDTAWAIENIAKRFPDIYVGAGTVITTEQVDCAKSAGARYIISPNTDRNVIERTVSLGMLSIPGAFTPSEIVAAYNYGAAFVKLFPAGNLGSAYIKAIRAPISHIPLLAVGGVDLTNLTEFYNAGICGFGIGSNIIKKQFVEKGDYPALTKLAREYVNIVSSLGKE
jgi:2-dehydro-3-deoxyphosphogluconate aldolase/(4S)-4-hydroxy-2-oxoglutarate aldolase